MDCNETKWLLDAYVDGELERTRQLDMETHLAGCSTCTKAVEATINFRHSVRMNMPVYKAPPELKATIRAALRKVSESEPEWISELRRPLLYAAAVLVVCLFCVCGLDGELLTTKIENWSLRPFRIIHTRSSPITCSTSPPRINIS